MLLVFLGRTEGGQGGGGTSTSETLSPTSFTISWLRADDRGHVILRPEEEGMPPEPNTFPEFGVDYFPV